MFKSLQEVKDANRKADAGWFDPETIKYHGVTFPMGQELIRGRFFITEENQFYDDEPRVFKVWRASDEGHVLPIATAWTYHSLEEAQDAARVAK